MLYKRMLCLYILILRMAGVDDSTIDGAIQQVRVYSLSILMEICEKVSIFN